MGTFRTTFNASLELTQMTYFGESAMTREASAFVKYILTA